MALKLVVAPKAERDLEDIAAFIAQDNPSAAYNALLRIERSIDLLLERPFLGPILTRPLRPDLRKMTVSPHIIFYRLTRTELQIVRVLHSARDLNDPELFQ